MKVQRPFVVTTWATMTGLMLGWILSGPSTDTEHQETSNPSAETTRGQNPRSRTANFDGLPWNTIADLIASGSRTDIEQWQALAGPELEDNHRQSIIHALLRERLEELQPSGSADEDLALDILAQTDPAAALQKAIAIDENATSAIDHFTTRVVLRAIAREDPRLGVSLAKELQGNDDDDFYVASDVAYEVWAQIDPQAAYEAALYEPTGEVLSYRVLTYWLDIDPATAAPAILKHAEIHPNHYPLRHLMDRWARFDSAAARDWVRSVQNEGTRNDAIRHLSNAFCDVSLQSTGAPALAASLYYEAPPGTRLSAKEIASTWATSDPQGALEWAESLDTETERTVAAAGIVSTLASIDVSGAAGILANLEYNKTFDEAYSSVAAALATQDITIAEQWAASLTDAASGVAFESIYQRVAADPTKWDELIARPPSAFRDKALQSMARQQANDDPAGAATKIDFMPEDQRSGIISHIVARWADHDRDAAGDWIASLPDADRDFAQLLYSQQLAYNMPEHALEYAKTISNPQKRTDAMRTAIEQLGYLSPGDALAEWRAADFSEESRTAQTLRELQAIVDYLTKGAL